MNVQKLCVVWQNTSDKLKVKGYLSMTKGQIYHYINMKRKRVILRVPSLQSVWNLESLFKVGACSPICGRCKMQFVYKTSPNLKILKYSNPKWNLILSEMGNGKDFRKKPINFWTTVVHSNQIMLFYFNDITFFNKCSQSLLGSFFFFFQLKIAFGDRTH